MQSVQPKETTPEQPSLGPAPSHRLDRFLDEFATGIRSTLVESWMMSLVASDMKNASGSVFGQMGLYLLMDIMGLPTPRIGGYKITSNVIGFSSLMRADPIFFLQAQREYYAAMIEFFKGVYLSAERTAVSKAPLPLPPEGAPLVPKDSPLAYVPSKHALTWLGSPLTPTTSAEWVSQVEGGEPPPLSIGAPCVEIVQVEKGVQRTYWAAEIRRGQDGSELLARNCCQALVEPVLVRHLLLPEHPFAAWISGHRRMGDVVFRTAEVATKKTTVGEWAAIDEGSMIRRAVIEALSSSR